MRYTRSFTGARRRCGPMVVAVAALIGIAASCGSDACPQVAADTVASSTAATETSGTAPADPTVTTDSKMPVSSAPDSNTPDSTTLDSITPDSIAPATTAPTDSPDLVEPTPTVLEGETPCPETDGSSPHVSSFSAAPPLCIDPTHGYNAVVATSVGTLTVALDPTAAPIATNNFVVLARYHYFDATNCHRIIPNFVAQCGDPTGLGTGSPGYSFADELPAAGSYRIGSLVMANSGPDTNGSQFFFVTGTDGTALPPAYSLFGQVTSGLDTTIAALDRAGNPADNGIPPLTPVEIYSVTIVES